jgi:hypothetical protein
MVQNFLVCDGVVASARVANKSLLDRRSHAMVDCSVKIALQ